MENTQTVLLVLNSLLLLAAGFITNLILQFRLELLNEKENTKDTLEAISKVHNDLVNTQITLSKSIQDLQDRTTAFEFKMRAK